MSNPYEILGIREGASIDEVKRAYKELVKKYHPDQYQNHPLSDLAEEKLKEINQAYDYLMKQAESSGRNNNSYNNGRSSDGYNNPGQTANRGTYDQIRMNINNGNFGAAEEMLSRVSYRDAEWNYLGGLIYMRKGWYNEAYNSIRTAVNMDPANLEYRDALNRMSNANNQYQSTVFNRRGYNNNPDMCTMCQCLICADCCSEGMGGDLIGCC